MGKLLQVVLTDAEMDEVRQAARRQRLTVGEWVRQTLRAARAQHPTIDPGRRLRAIRKAAEYSFPTADIQRMLDEIERG